MVTDTGISADQPITVLQMTPVDVSMMRDPGMRALVLLAVSLGWNALYKPNSPMVITARDGTQRRLPTNTSIRMSVFQSALSTVMVHTDDREASPELIDAIVRETKVDRDHERRLRLAIGETTQEHRQRLANDKAAERKREPDEHLTQHIVVKDAPETVVSFEPPYDGQSHGALMSREPFIAHYGTHSGKASNKSVSAYVSDSSFERVWQDGYVDYECPLCGRIFGSSRGAGSHRQVHYKAGDVERTEGPAWMRAQRGERTLRGEEAPPVRQKIKRRTKAEMEAERVPDVSDLVFEEPPTEEAVNLSEKAVDKIVEQNDVILAIAALVSPQLVASVQTWERVARNQEEMIARLDNELAEANEKLRKLQADWDALRGLIDGR